MILEVLTAVLLRLWLSAVPKILNMKPPQSLKMTETTHWRTQCHILNEYNPQLEFSFSDSYWQHSVMILSNEWQILTEQCWGSVKQVTDTDSTVLRYCQHILAALSNKWQILRAQCWGTVKRMTDNESTTLRYCHTSDRYWQHNDEVLSSKWQILCA
jgi:hypothetical protein